VALVILIVATWWPSLMTLLHNNLGSVALNRALLNPDMTEDQRLTRATDAGRSLQTALAWDLLNGQAYYNLAAIYDLWADPASAAQALARAAALLPRDPVTQLRHGLALARSGQEQRAREAWRAADAATYFVNRGQALAGQSDHQGALRQYRRALAVEPQMAEAHLRLGQTLSRLGREAEALEALAAAARSDPGESERPHLLQAEIHVARGEWTAALVAYREAAERSPRDPEPLYRRGSLLSQELGDEEAALANFQEALAIDPEHRPSRLALAELHARRGDCRAAERSLAPILVPSPDGGSPAQLHLLLAECLLEQGRAGQALAHLDQVREPAIEAPPVALRLAQGYAQAGRFQDAVDAYRRVLELDPQNQDAHQALAELGYDPSPPSDATGGQ
jgi:tetratricopeptide (TPR) repeat protein